METCPQGVSLGREVSASAAAAALCRGACFPFLYFSGCAGDPLVTVAQGPMQAQPYRRHVLIRVRTWAQMRWLCIIVRGPLPGSQVPGGVAIGRRSCRRRQRGGTATSRVTPTLHGGICSHGAGSPSLLVGGRGIRKESGSTARCRSPSGVVSTTETNLRAMPQSFSSSAAAQAAMVVLRR